MLEIIKKYNPVIVSNEDMLFDYIVIKKQELDIISIVDYYQSNESLNPHLVVPNYLKLPQALEAKND